jgi:hypothetical protein
MFHDMNKYNDAHQQLDEQGDRIVVCASVDIRTRSTVTDSRGAPVRSPQTSNKAAEMD